MDQNEVGIPSINIILGLVKVTVCRYCPAKE